jgi:hypothetical protein
VVDRLSTSPKAKSEQTSKRPIIFVAHSLDGIIVNGVGSTSQSHVVNAQLTNTGAHPLRRRSTRSSRKAPLYKLSTYGIIFMDTTHQGGNGVALGRLMVNVASEFVVANSGLLLHLERDSEWLSYFMLRIYRSELCSVHYV